MTNEAMLEVNKVEEEKVTYKIDIDMLIESFGFSLALFARQIIYFEWKKENSEEDFEWLREILRIIDTNLSGYNENEINKFIQAFNTIPGHREARNSVPIQNFIKNPKSTIHSQLIDLIDYYKETDMSDYYKQLGSLTEYQHISTLSNAVSEAIEVVEKPIEDDITRILSSRFF